MTPHEKIAAVYAALGLLVAGIGWAFHWWVLDVRYWLPFGLRRQAPDYLPGPDGNGSAALMGQSRELLRAGKSDLAGPALGGGRPGEIHYDEWEQLDPDQAADQLIAEWHDEAGPLTITGDVWDQWWAGVDGFERECMLVHDWLVREERLWAELKAETRELCAA